MSTLANNQSRGSGGAIRNEGFLLVVSGTFAGNDGLAGGGGAIANTGELYVAKSTFSGNHSAGAGAIWNDVTGRFCGHSLTLADNFTHTGGPWNAVRNDPGGVAWLANTVVYASQPGTNCVGLVQSYGFNLSNDLSCDLQATGDWQGLEPLLGPLASAPSRCSVARLADGGYAGGRGSSRRRRYQRAADPRQT